MKSGDKISEHTQLLRLVARLREKKVYTDHYRLRPAQAAAAIEAFIQKREEAKCYLCRVNPEIGGTGPHAHLCVECGEKIF